MPNHHAWSALALVVVGTVGFGATNAACSSSGGDNAVSSTEQALKPLTPDEILGTISYGQTIGPVSYVSPPHYRAWSFTGNAGDAVVLTVSALNPTGYPRVWLLASDFTTITTGKYSAGETTTTVLKRNLPTSGTFYLCFRDVNLAAGTFDVSLQGPGGDGGPQDGGGDADAGTDSGVDTGVDSGVDSGDSGVDTGVDSGGDAGGPGSWTALASQPSFSADTALLLTDGTVMVHAYSDVAWWRLTPDANGSYVNGSWSQLASLPAGYAPLYFASAFLPDGRLLVEGGEYNSGAQVETTLGAIYDPVGNAWTAVSPPSGWTTIGDAESILLPNGTLMLSNSQSPQQALFDPSTLSWTTTGSGKADSNSEEGWALLPNGKVLTVDSENGTQSELYDPGTGSWSLAGSTVVSLVDTGSLEIGPAVLMPDGRVFATGATPNTALYGTDGTWTAGPTFPTTSDGQVDAADAPAALLPNGHVLVASSPGIFQNGVHFLEFDGTSFTEVARTPNAPNVSSYNERFLVLPTGQILATDGSADVEVYTPGGGPQSSWAPSIGSVPSSLNRGSTYTVSGKQLNGLSQGAAYGDDAQAATNYPLVRITNNATQHVFYAKTHGHSTMGVATGNQTVSTSFDVPAGAETGASKMSVVANGIASAPVSVTVN